MLGAWHRHGTAHLRWGYLGDPMPSVDKFPVGGKAVTASSDILPCQPWCLTPWGLKGKILTRSQLGSALTVWVSFPINSPNCHNPF